MMHRRVRDEIDEIFRDNAEQRPSRRSARRQTKRRKAKRATRRTERPLASVGGGKRLYGTYKGRDYKAIVYANGRIRLRNQFYDTPSGAARAAVGRSVNGWTFWHIRRAGELVPLTAVR